MTSSTYIELHARSAFSFLEGASLPEALIARSAELGSPAMALLDRNSLSGAVRFHKQAQKSGVRAIIGAEVIAAEGLPLRAAGRVAPGLSEPVPPADQNQTAHRTWRSGKRRRDR